MKISNTKKRKQQHGLTVQEIYVIIRISLVHVWCHHPTCLVTVNFFFCVSLEIVA